MRPQKLIPLLLLALAARSAALSEDGKKAGEEIVSALKEELKELAGNDVNENRGYAVKQYLRQIQNALAQENSRQLIQYLDNYDNYSPTEKVLQSIAKLKEAIKAEQKQKSAAIIADLEGTLAKAREKVVQAKAPEDLDELLSSLSREKYSTYEDSQGNDPSVATIRSLTMAIGNAKQFVTSWQDYLQAKKSGNAAQAASAIQSLSRQENLLIPRSQIIDRLEQERAKPDTLAAIIDGITSLDRIAPALKQLNALQQSSRNSESGSSSLNEPIQTLGRMDKTYREFTAGLPVNLEVFNSGLDSSGQTTRSDFTRLKAELLILVLPRYLAIPETPKANDTENVDQFLSRALSEAKGRGDAAACQRVREAQQTLGRSNRYSNDDTNALRDYAAGQNQLAARQYMLAVISLQSALKAGSDLLPVDKIGGQLETLQKEHPEEFKQGMTEFLTPKPTPEFDYSRMPYRSYMDPRMTRGMDMGRYSGMQQQPPATSIVLPVPGKEAEPAKPTPKSEEKPKTPEKAAGE